LTLTKGKELALWTRQPPKAGSKVRLSLSGIVLVGSTKRVTLPPICNKKSRLVGEGLGNEAAGSYGAGYGTQKGGYSGGYGEAPSPPKKGVATEASTKTPTKKEADTAGCDVVRFGSKAPNPERVDVNQVEFPTRAVIPHANVVISGNSLESQTCTLRGVVTFQSIKGQAEAQLDPNLRNPYDKTNLCFPLAAMVFFAGVVSGDSSPIHRHVAVQLEPHGRLRILEPELRDLRVRLDGITYYPFMRFNKPNPTCAPYCFPMMAAGVTGSKMKSAGCVKYCTPPELRLVNGALVPINCQCDMVKRLSCFQREGSKTLKCGQFKQLVRTHTLDKGTVDAKVCGEVCGRQLSAL